MFGAYLVKAGLATPSDIVDALDEQRSRRIPIGKLALRNAKLTIRQIWLILDHQALEGGRFGEIAVDMGFLTAEDRDMLLLQQHASRPALGSLLVRSGVLSKAQLETALSGYHAHAERANASQGERELRD